MRTPLLRDAAHAFLCAFCPALGLRRASTQQFGNRQGSWEDFYLIYLGDLPAVGHCLQVLEATRRDEHPAFKRGDGLVVGADRIAEVLADLAPVARHDRDALVQLTAKLADLLRVARQRLLL